MTTTEQKTRGRKVSRKVKGLAIGSGAFLALTGLTFAGIAFFSQSFDGTSTSGDFTVSGPTTAACNDSGTTNDPVKTSGTLGTYLDGSYVVQDYHVASCTVDLAATPVVTFANTYDNYAPSVQFGGLQAVAQPMELVGVRVLDSGTGSPWTSANPPVVLEIPEIICGPAGGLTLSTTAGSVFAGRAVSANNVAGASFGFEIVLDWAPVTAATGPCVVSYGTP